MKMILRALIASSLLLPVATLASEGDATILWKTFTATPSAGITITWSDQITYVFADSPVASSAAMAAALDWTSARTITESSGDATGTADADADVLHASTKGNTTSALGQAWREGVFTMSGTGTVTFEVDYTVSVVGLAGNNSDFTTASVGLMLEANTPRTDALLNSINGTDTKSGRLRLIVDNDSAGPVSLKLIGAATTITTAVPEPATSALLAGGLGLLGWSVRRKTRREEAPAA